MEKELEEKVGRIAVLEERSRIMREIDEADLPLGFWPLIKDIINPPQESIKN